MKYFKLLKTFFYYDCSTLKSKSNKAIGFEINNNFFSQIIISR